MTPAVTVFIPVYNRERYVLEAIDSVLRQSFTDFELLVVDDGSTDRTREVVEAVHDRRIRLLANGRNLGIPATRNRGLLEARGRYIALLDSDDWSHPQRLARQVSFLDAHPDYAEIGSWGRAMDAAGRPLRAIQYRPVHPDDVKAQFLFRCAIKNRSVMGRTDVLRHYGYRAEFLRCQDYDMHVRIARDWKVGNLPQMLVRGRLHDGRWTGRTQDLGRDSKLRIIAMQLDDLGLSCSNDDVERHYRLARPQPSDLASDGDSLRWAEDWLRRLVAANAVRGFVAPAALERAIAPVWTKLCWKARGDGAALVRWRRVPSARGLLGSFTRKLSELGLFATSARSGAAM